MRNSIISFLILLCCSNCKEAPLPKPQALLRLEYPQASYKKLTTAKAYTFDRNTQTTVTQNSPSSLVLNYPLMKAAIYLTHKKVSNNLQTLLVDAQKLTYEHVVKADHITAKEYANTQEQVYGMLYEVSGNAASQAQFYATDSTRHFLTGSLYFYARPNYDSLLPAAVYLQKDIKRLVESLRWKKPLPTKQEYNPLNAPK